MQHYYDFLFYKSLVFATLVFTTTVYAVASSKKTVRNEKISTSFSNLFTLWLSSNHKFPNYLFTSQSRIVNYFLAFASCQGTGGGGGGGGHGGVAKSRFPDYDTFQDFYQNIKINDYNFI